MADDLTAVSAPDPFGERMVHRDVAAVCVFDAVHDARRSIEHLCHLDVGLKGARHPAMVRNERL